MLTVSCWAAVAFGFSRQHPCCHPRVSPFVSHLKPQLQPKRLSAAALLQTAPARSPGPAALPSVPPLVGTTARACSTGHTSGDSRSETIPARCNFAAVSFKI